MQGPRFIFVSTAGSPADAGDARLERVFWMLVSPNNRQLGRGAVDHTSYADALASVQLMQSCGGGALRIVAPHESTGQWIWRLQIGTTTVAVSSRTYLRLRECHYNLDRFLEALPSAQVVAGTRTTRAESGAEKYVRPRTVLR